MGKRYRKGKNTDYARLDIMTGYSQSYADGWDRVFGKDKAKNNKKKDVVCGKSL